MNTKGEGVYCVGKDGGVWVVWGVPAFKCWSMMQQYIGKEVLCIQERWREWVIAQLTQGRYIGQANASLYYNRLQLIIVDFPWVHVLLVSPAWCAVTITVDAPILPMWLAIWLVLETSPMDTICFSLFWSTLFVHWFIAGMVSKQELHLLLNLSGKEMAACLLYFN